MAHPSACHVASLTPQKHRAMWHDVGARLAHASVEAWGSKLVACPSARHVAFLLPQKRCTMRHSASERLSAKLILGFILGRRLFLGAITKDTIRFSEFE